MCVLFQWPCPAKYNIKQALGSNQKTMFEPPSFTIGLRREMTIEKKGNLPFLKENVFKRNSNMKKKNRNLLRVLSSYQIKSRIQLSWNLKTLKIFYFYPFV